MKIHWYCGYFRSATDSLFTELEECGAEFDTEVSVVDWDTGFCHTTCPRCGAILCQQWDDPTALEPSHIVCADYGQEDS